MNDERTAELISAALDDALTQSERTELDKRLAESTHARDYHDQMKKLDTRLRETPDVTTPYELNGQIMRGLPVTTKRAGGLLLAPFWSGVMRYGLAATAGVLFAVGIYETKPVDATRMSGTMAPKAIVLDGFRFDVEGLSSAVDLEQRGDELALDVSVESDGDTNLVIRFPTDTYRLGMLEQAENEFQFCEFSNGVIRAGVAGNHRFAIALMPRDGSTNSKDAAITLEYSGNGRMVHKTLVPGR